jgi:hypothetical protein
MYPKANSNEHCCSEMEERLEFECSHHKNPFECPDNLVSYSADLNEYGLIIHDGGSSSILIKYCPWCGARLPESKRGEFSTKEEGRS